MPTPTSPPPKVKDDPRPHQQLNSGTILLQPSPQLFQTVSRILEDETTVKMFTFPDQDLLAVAFHGKWRPLPWYYNALRTLPKMHPQLWDDRQVRCVHFILADKPWRSRMAPRQECSKPHDWWWQTFDRMLPALEALDADGARWVLTQVDYDGCNV